MLLHWVLTLCTLCARFRPVQLCFRILEQEKKVPFEEFNFFLYGGVVVDRYVQLRH